MRKFSPCFALLLASCVPIQPLGRSALLVRPEFGRTTQTTITPYTKADINHLTLKLYTTAEQDLGISKDLLNLQLDNPIVFSNLKNNTNYRIRAYAYLTSGTGSCISTNDSSSYTDVLVGTDDRPTLATLSVKLIDRDFNGQGTGSLTITPGGYSDPGASSIYFASPQGVVTLLAGNGATGSVDGIGTAATFQKPVAITVDTAGNAYVADMKNNLVRKVTLGGVVTTILGNGVASSVDGIGTAATVNVPHGIAVDKSGNVFVSDSGGSRIRKINLAGVVTTFVGNGEGAYLDGTGTSAKVSGPYGLAFDSSENLYVADVGNRRIRKISPAGVVSTFAGNGGTSSVDGMGTAASFRCPAGVAVDSSGNVYVSDYYDNRIRKITPAGMVSTFVGNGSPTSVDGVGTAATIHSPWGLTMDYLGNLFVGERDGARVRKVTPAGVVSTFIGNGTGGFVDGTGTAARVNDPIGVAMGENGYLYLLEHLNNCVRVVK